MPISSDVVRTRAKPSILGPASRLSEGSMYMEIRHSQTNSRILQCDDVRCRKCFYQTLDTIIVNSVFLDYFDHDFPDVYQASGLSLNNIVKCFAALIVKLFLPRFQKRR